MKNHNHAEAFKWMYYESEDKSYGTWVYNTRDGVTPFIIILNDIQLSHSEWQKDLYRPEYVPKAGDYIFRDMLREEADKIMRDRIEKHPEYLGNNDPEEIIHSFVETCIENGEPVLALVNKKLIAEKL